MRTVLLVRHAHAGQRGSHPGSDLDRPLSALGRVQAAAIAAALGPATTSVATSSAVRCRQTVAPLAAAAGVEVVDQPLLLEGSDPARTYEWLVTLPDGAVACSHGDVIGGVLSRLRGDGLRGDDTAAWPKGGWHRLTLDGDVVRSVTRHPPSED